jgi:hypothetical protein
MSNLSRENEKKYEGVLHIAYEGVLHMAYEGVLHIAYEGVLHMAYEGVLHIAMAMVETESHEDTPAMALTYGMRGWCIV